ncbi:DUF221-domain-containing protein [Desarmillaria tabescens]|uniref:DUF221-domain-containing protein n=1 Tax=Armillaria tabescens TaxID=1929756 RepID=A0AA39N8F3_ARMTA|nr:DUF221-domain-containing protein [Desarmillaria tabescens]KAK0460943.1 DUF221-domain-containing protein [Desarmillaria tabescens]
MPGTDVDPLGQAAEADRNLAPAAVGFQFLIMAAASIATLITFNVIRSKHKRIYQPKVKYHVGDKPPPRISDSFFGWIPPLIHTKEPELIKTIGLDGVAFLRFLSLLRTLFSGIGILACGVLIPVNVIYNRSDKVDSRQTDILSILTIRDVKGNSLYAAVAVSYLITALVIALVYIYWRSMLRLRKEWFRSPEYTNSFYARTLSITHVPKKLQSDAGIKNILNTVKMPYPATAVHISRQVGVLPDLIKYHNQTVRELETILVKYLKDGKVGAKRPTIRVGGCCGIGGVRKDAIEFYTTKLKRTEAAVEAYRSGTDTRKPEKYGFASLAAVPYAHFAARKLDGKHPKGTTITLAPDPKDIICENMNRTDSALARRKFIGFLWMGVICFLSLIPVFFVSALANLDAVSATGYIPFLRSWSLNSKVSFAFVSGVLPPMVAGIFSFFLPKIMRWLSQYMGGLTHARLDRAVVARYFAFTVISQLIIFTLIGVAFSKYCELCSVSQIVALIGDHASAKEIFQNLNKLPNKISETYINQSSYWLQYFFLRYFTVLIFDLAQALNFVWISFKTQYGHFLLLANVRAPHFLRCSVFGRTPRDIREWTQPPEFEYALYYANLLFLVSVAFLFAPLVPLVPLAAAVVFWLSSWVHKYQLMYVYVTKVETGGRLWNVVINRLLFSVVMMQALLVLTIGLQYKFKSFQWLSTIPPIFIIIVFKWYLIYKFDNAFRYYAPTQEDLRNTKVHSSRGDIKGHRLQHRYGHPALTAELFTPMVHAKMMPLLKEVYKGKVTLADTTAKLNEYGGQNVQAQVFEGIKIAAVAKEDLEYDPDLYRRSRTNAGWDGRSMTTATMLSTSYAPSIQSSSYNTERTSTLSSPGQMSEYSSYSWSPEFPSSPAAGPSSDCFNQRPQYTSMYSNATSITQVMEQARFADPNALQPTSSINMPSPHGQWVSSPDPYTSIDQQVSPSHSQAAFDPYSLRSQR